MDDFEQELREATLRLPAPPSLKRKILARRKQQNTQRVHALLSFWQPWPAERICGTTLKSAARAKKPGSRY